MHCFVSIATCGCEATAFLSFIGFRWKIRRKTRETAHALASDIIALNNAAAAWSEKCNFARKPKASLPLDLLSFS